MTITWSTCTAKKGVVLTERYLEESTWRIKIRYLTLWLYHLNTNILVIFLLRSRCLIFMQYLFFATCTDESDQPPFCKLWNTIYREIINIMTIMMKTIKKRLNLYTKKYLDGLGSCLFLEFTFVLFAYDIQSP
jgi:hypothetical protein